MKKIISVIVALTCTAVVAQWSSDPMVNTQITTAPLNQNTARIISDGQGGAIIAWVENENSSDNWLYAQRVNEQGFIQWQTNGVLICDTTGSRSFDALSSMIADGTGGAIIIWVDQRDGANDIYTQRIDGNGVVQWTANGVKITPFHNTNESPDIASDGKGGAIITWSQRSSSVGIFAQRVSSTGVMWSSAAHLSTNDEQMLQAFPRIIADGTGGSIVAWEDHRATNGMSQSAIWAQHVDSSGNVIWDSDGIDVGPHGASNQYFNLRPEIISDGLDGAIITWWSSYFDTATHKSVQITQVSGSGSSGWSAVLCEGDGNHQYPDLVTDGSGGAIVSWYDNRNGSDQIFAQRVDNAGNVQWQINGIQIKQNTAQMNNVYLTLVSDNAGGATIVWDDYRMPGNNPKIYAQRIDGTGMILWTIDGEVISSYDGDYDPVIATDGLNGAIVAFWSTRPSDANIYAQQINGVGQLGTVTNITDDKQIVNSFILQQNYPNPFNPATKIKYSISLSGLVALKVYNLLGEEVAALVNEYKSAGNYEIQFDASELSSGIYFYKLETSDFSETKKMVVLK